MKKNKKLKKKKRGRETVVKRWNIQRGSAEKELSSIKCNDDINLSSISITTP